VKLTEEYFKIEDLKEWLCGIALNNLDQYDCITDIIKRLPGFERYVKDKRADDYEHELLKRLGDCIVIKCNDPAKLKELMEKWKKGEI